MNHRLLLSVLALALLAGALQATLLWRAPVPALDAVEHISIAQAFERDGTRATLQAETAPPLFPWLVRWVHAARSAIAGEPATWGASAQWTAACAVVLLAPIVVWFASGCVGRSAALIAGSLVVGTPQVARLGADGLGESVHLLAFAMALGCAARAFAARGRGAGAGWLLGCGVLSALALAARPEALILPLAVCACLAWQCIRQPETRRAALAAGGCFALGTAAGLGPYLMAANASSWNVAHQRILGRQPASERVPLNDLRLSATGAAALEADRVVAWWNAELSGDSSIFGPALFGRKDAASSSRFQGLAATVARLGSQVVENLQLLLLLAPAGLVGAFGWSRRRSSLLLISVATLNILGAFWLGLGSGYLENRHLLPLVIVTLPTAAVGLERVAEWLAAQARTRNPVAWRGVLMIACGIGAVLLIIKAPHVSRTAHRDAAEWLCTSASPVDAVLDTRGFTALYTNRPTYRYEAAPEALSDPRLRYIVVEGAEFTSDSPRGQTMRQVLASGGWLAAEFGASTDRVERHVLVFCWQPARWALGREVVDAR